MFNVIEVGVNGPGLNIIQNLEEADRPFYIYFFHWLTGSNGLRSSLRFLMTLPNVKLKPIPNVIMQLSDQLGGFFLPLIFEGDGGESFDD